MVAFPNKEAFGSLTLRKMILIDRVISLIINSHQRAI
jgi:hypothetical protein